MYEIFVADIGGTNSRFALFTAGPDGLVSRRRFLFPTGEAASFRELFARLLPQLLPALTRRPDMAVLAVPGVVFDGRRCDPPNIVWDLDLDRDWKPQTEPDPEPEPKSEPENDIMRALFQDTPVRMINDFEAQAFAMSRSGLERAAVIQAGRYDSGRAMAMIGAGTGLGHCGLMPHSDGFVAVPSEAGHAAFAFAGPGERDFETFVLERLEVRYCCQEHVVSGQGLALVHEFVSGERLAPVEVAARLGDHPETVRWFARFYGRAARQYVLALMATGGLGIAGGVAARNPCLVRDPAFLEEFRSCRGYETVLGEVPVRLFADEDNGLFGAACFGLQELERAAPEPLCR
ncbi:MAG: glucokinase [Desulfovibrio sp.]